MKKFILLSVFMVLLLGCGYGQKVNSIVKKGNLAKLEEFISDDLQKADSSKKKEVLDELFTNIRNTRVLLGKDGKYIRINSYVYPEMTSKERARAENYLIHLTEDTLGELYLLTALYLRLNGKYDIKYNNLSKELGERWLEVTEFDKNKPGELSILINSLEYSGILYLEENNSRGESLNIAANIYIKSLENISYVTKDSTKSAFFTAGIWKKTAFSNLESEGKAISDKDLSDCEKFFNSRLPKGSMTRFPLEGVKQNDFIDGIATAIDGSTWVSIKNEVRRYNLIGELEEKWDLSNKGSKFFKKPVFFGNKAFFGDSELYQFTKGEKDYKVLDLGTEIDRKGSILSLSFNPNDSNIIIAYGNYKDEIALVIVDSESFKVTDYKVTKHKFPISKSIYYYYSPFDNEHIEFKYDYNGQLKIVPTNATGGSVKAIIPGRGMIVGDTEHSTGPFMKKEINWSISPDNNLIALHTADNRISLWSYPDLKYMKTIPGKVDGYMSSGSRRSYSHTQGNTEYYYLNSTSSINVFYEYNTGSLKFIDDKSLYLDTNIAIEKNGYWKKDTRKTVLNIDNDNREYPEDSMSIPAEDDTGNRFSSSFKKGFITVSWKEGR